MSKIKSYFLRQGLTRVKVDEYLAQNFYTAGYAGVQIVQSGLGTRVHIFAERPALVIGRRGATIRKLQAVLEKVFGLEGVQVTVSQPDNMELNARVQAFRIARALEMGYHFRRVAMATMRRIMEAGAVGVEIVISGKLSRERARFEKLQAGKVIKTGNVVDVYTDRAIAYAKLPLGIIGVEVRIIKPEAAKPDILLRPDSEAATIAAQLSEEASEGQGEQRVKEIIEGGEEGGEVQAKS
ncbi:30S ribosomal protein S3 [Acidilobus sp.]|jgi:small subunit ribosomal protein S3|uniref:30S ribosomal protein S3 n=1 Tax=Acidilobus sp. TaxID=1872109 RepID=UPI003D060A14